MAAFVRDSVGINRTAESDHDIGDIITSTLFGKIVDSFIILSEDCFCCCSIFDLTCGYRDAVCLTFCAVGPNGSCDVSALPLS